MAERGGEPNRRRLLKLMGATAAGAVAVPAGTGRRAQPRLVGRNVPFIRKDGLLFKDQSKDGRLHPYEDWRLPAEVRARDLVGRMTLAEKAGTMVHPLAGAATAYFLDEVPAGYPAVYKPIRPMIADRHITSLLSMFATETAVLVSQNNTLQEIAETGRLGIPLSLSTDPRNGFAALGGQSSPAGEFTKWPGTLGFAAIGDRDLVRAFADTARQEYRAVGFSIALSPQADLATEPRWNRINGTFGEDVDVVTDLTAQYIRGFQHGSGGIGPESVVCVVKHFAGHGAQVGGYDSHFLYGKYAAFPGHGFPAHVRPFRTAVHGARVGSVMTMYSIAQQVTLFGRPLEQVGAAFNRQLITDLLRRDIGFDGVVLTDWQVTDDPPTDPEDPVSGKPWGVETLTEEERFAKAIDAGADQFGGTSSTDRIVAAVQDGRVDERRIDASVFRILLQKFRQGLFEAPFADLDVAQRTVGNGTFRAAALRAQHRSVVLLQNRDRVLPLRAGSGTKVYGYGLSAAALTAYGLTPVADPARADLAVLLLQTPRSGLHLADLDYKDTNADYQAVLAVRAAGIPSVAAVQLDRPAILTDIRDKVTALVAHFGLSEEALLDVLTGRARPEGRLPFDLPATPASVVAQRPDLPYDLEQPLYRRGFRTPAW
ncbi:glycoside hydrolase family 3 C-terminal domain-containing protein [Streptomyces sp. NBC_01478]|uniref:glycoside hydrolase family 3 protein n=1 Tax=Streptomyces sp. NBC_01478 TaxID=2903882 RepID=UPI002E353E26|nr:glycoside hydrolase family 3 N-terminal domain-containing protein [Streptomyces sp. NBC_01478]